MSRSVQMETSMCSISARSSSGMDKRKAFRKPGRCFESSQSRPDQSGECGELSKAMLMSRLRCPSCHESELPLFLTAAEIESELVARERFFVERLGRRFPRAEMKDITDLALGIPASI